jgi:hypothetical protein
MGTPTAGASGGVCNSDCSANVEFESSGEHLTVHDYSPDGWSAVALFDTHRDGSVAEFWNSNSYDGPAATFNLDLPEGTAVRYKACLGHASTGELSNCSGWYNDAT